MAITNQERVGKAMELLRAGLAPFVEREFKSQHQAQGAEAALPRRPGCRAGRRSHRGQEAARRVGRGGAPEAHVGGVERRLREDAGPRRAVAGAGAARRPQQVGASGAVFQRRRRTCARLDGAAPRGGLGPAGGRRPEDEDGAAPAHLRERKQEVDFVVRAGRRLAAIEVKSGCAPQAHRGMGAFAAAFKPSRSLLVGGDGIDLAEFLSRPALHWISG